MHNLEYKNLPYALSSYCTHARHTSRYTSNRNFILPPTRTIRGQTSIKFAGPKAWNQIPNALKEIAFRKPFSKQLKKSIVAKLKDSAKNLPQNSYLANKKKKNQGTSSSDPYKTPVEDPTNLNSADFELSLSSIFLENDDSFIFIGFSDAIT